ncbi:Uncharacterized conserved protein YabE, contains G5 and tandem DUF348 domains [Evansella caseinilytica]|uniref:Uncharacterized conserved protein YabE, contains G5 and tandem DUF348 domains n=1 Tax=Evansella caseinilytica TaxID=1503961 RepID=A0A1H3UXG3_9BACI|nr:G5 and 3D domain-containing protein [Evansella caseinilytica]SDZ66515.1 Uncharacterized conserved protein YabE, contains G5 and tandem DUF348 domains [Evansella caseinilytica]
MTQWMKRLFSKISWRKLAISSVGLLTLIGILVIVIYEVTKTSVTVMADDEETTVYTHASTVGEVLEERGISIGVHDYIEPSANTVITEAMNIVYIPAQQVFVNIAGVEDKVWTTAGTVQELMEQLNIDVNEHDAIEPSLSTELSPDTKIFYEAAFLVTLLSDGKKKKIWTTSTTVADFLEREDIELNESDRVEPSVDEWIDKEQEVSVVRVEKVTDVVEVTVDYATVKQSDSSIEQGSEVVLESGQDGRIKKHYEVILENGEEVSRELVKEEVVQESQDRVVAVGTKEPAPTVSRSSASTSSSSGSSSSSSSSSASSSSASDSGDWQTFSATAYTAFCNGCSGITATGINLRANPDAKVIAVDPNVIPLGSRVEVKGMGTYLAADTGGAVSGNKIDIFIPDQDKVASFGHRTVKIRIVK